MKWSLTWTEYHRVGSTKGQWERTYSAVAAGVSGLTLELETTNAADHGWMLSMTRKNVFHCCHSSYSSDNDEDWNASAEDRRSTAVESTDSVHVEAMAWQKWATVDVSMSQAMKYLRSTTTPMDRIHGWGNIPFHTWSRVGEKINVRDELSILLMTMREELSFDRRMLAACLHFVGHRSY